MKVRLSVFLAAVSALFTGCAASEDASRLSEQDVDEDEAQQASPDQTPAPWTLVAPGVWERPRLGGGMERMGVGRSGFDFALQRARQEHTNLLAMQDRAPSERLEQRITEDAAHVEFLESTLADDRLAEALSDDGLAEQAMMKGDDGPSGGDPTPKSGSACGGYYRLDVDFFYGIAIGSVTATADWEEFPPLAPYPKTMHTYAYAEYSGAPISNSDADSYGPFVAWGAHIESTASMSPDFAPYLYGSAYLIVSGGCNKAVFYEASN